MSSCTASKARDSITPVQSGEGSLDIGEANIDRHQLARISRTFVDLKTCSRALAELQL